MKKFVCALFVVMIMVIGIASAETGHDFATAEEAIGKLGIYNSYVISIEVMHEYLDRDDIDGFVDDYAKPTLELAENEDIMVIQLEEGSGIFYGFVYDIKEQELEMDDREILRVIYIILM